MPTTILIVDDDRFAQNVLETIFKQDRTFKGADLEIITAADGEAGLAAFKKHKPEIVISDLLMPKLDGFGLCKQIRAIAGPDKCTLLVLSGVYRDRSIADRLEAEYSAKFFAKPYQIKDLTKSVAKHLGIAPSDRRRSPTAAEPAIDVEPQDGSIGDTPLPQLLLKLLEQRASGRLSIKRGREHKSIDLILGHPVAATSNVREETLGHFVRHLGIINDVEHQQALEDASKHGTKLGAALIRAGVIDSQKLVELLSAQVRYKITQSLRWPDGTWSFEPGSEPANAGEPQDVEQLVLKGLRETATSSDVHRELIPLHGAALTLTERGAKYEGRFNHLLGNAGRAFKSGISIAQMVHAGVAIGDAELAADALIRAGLVEANEPTAMDMARMSTKVSFGLRPDTAPSIAALSEHSQITKLPRASADPDDPDDDLFSMLFSDTAEPSRMGANPLALVEAGDAVPAAMDAEESGVIDVSDIALSKPGGGPNSENDQARRMLLEEYLRVQGLDHYDILQVPRNADPNTIGGAAVERAQKFSLEWFSRFDLGRDYSKLEDLHRRYEHAKGTLLDDDRRRDYDAELAGGDLGPSAPSLDAEIAFRAAESLIAQDDVAGAIAKLEGAVQLAPTEADYHSLLGWARFVSGGKNALAADEARPALNTALRINPDHPRAHEYKGVITAILGTDDIEAIFHIERALQADPAKIAPLEYLEQCWRRRGELRPLERQYRKQIHRATSLHIPEAELHLWVKLGELYTELDDIESARVAYQSALRLDPSDAVLRATLTGLGSGAKDGGSDRLAAVRDHWRKDPSNAGPGQELMRVALQSKMWDTAFLAASALVALKQANEDAEQLYRRHRPRFVIRAHRYLDSDLWSHLAHEDDDRDIGMLFDLLAPIISRIAPLTMEDLELDEGSALSDTELPPGFLKVRDYISHSMGMLAPGVHVRTDFGHEVHVGAVEPPVLIVGDDILGAPERLELAFRLGRAMTYLRSGRAVGGSRPARVLKASMLGALTGAVPSASVQDPTGLIAQVRAAVDELEPQPRQRVHELASKTARQSATINLSRWQRALARTADRAGLLFCGDIPSAVRFVQDSSGPDSARELIEFALGTDHAYLRATMGLSVDV